MLNGFQKISSKSDQDELAVVVHARREERYEEPPLGARFSGRVDVIVQAPPYAPRRRPPPPPLQEFRVPGAPVTVSSSSGGVIAHCPMRPPPPPPPPSRPRLVDHIKAERAGQSREEPSSSIPDLEFDGTTVLCRVCGDKASGFHYGVHSCEGCKGFFRRSIQQKIQYRPCTKNQQCCILRINRNRCQYCRLKKCIAVGMSRDAVRFGRVPKREKARILAAMAQSSNSRAHEHAAAAELDDEPRLLARVVRAHAETCEFTRDRVAQMRASARNAPTYSMPTLACPLNPAPELQSEKEFSQRFAHVIRGVIDFAGLIPGFQLLTQDDKFTLLKSGLFDALFVRLICMFDAPMDSIICLNGQLMGRDSIQNGANARFLVDSTFKFAERINSMNLTDAEVGLFCAIVLITPDRPGLRNVELVERMHARLKSCLQTVISQSRPDRPTFLRELMDTLPDLRTLSTLHTEKLVVFRTEHKELLRQKMWGEDETVESLHHGGWPADAAEDAAESPLGSVSSSESACSAEAMEMYGHAPLLAATLAGGCPARRRADSGGSHGSLGSHGSDEDALMHGLRGPHAPTSRPQPQRYRKLDSPTDSGIESGNEKHERLAGGSSSSCSSPRSSLEEHADERHHRHAVEDMPVLKRVLQAPPLYDTGSLMDEAYKPHKKFRAMRQRDAAEAEPARPATYHAPATAPAPTSQLQMHLSRPQHSSLSSTHSVLAKSLMEGPRMTPEQMKRTDIIHAYIRRGEAAHAAAVAAADDSACPLRGAGLLSCTTSATTTPSPTYRARWTPSAHPAYSPSGESRPYAQSPHSTSPAPYNAGPHVTHASLVELQVDIADTPQPLNLSKKSPSPPPATAPTPTSAPYLAPHKVLLEA